MASKPESNSKLVSYLVVGKTGVGKTAIINSVAGKEIAEEGDELDIGTFDIKSHDVTHETVGITVRFWDTPGLFDMSKQSDEYVDQIRDKYEECDLVLYCSNMTDKRITDQDKRTVHAFTQSLGANFWQRSCFVLTFGNEVQNVHSETTAEFFENTLQCLRNAYGKVLKEAGVSSSIVDKIPFVPAGYHPWSPDKEMYTLPDGKMWISAFWASCFARVKDSQQVPHSVSPKRESRPSSRPSPRQEIPTREQCTYNTHRRDYISQDWFECATCWGTNSSFGCCWPCALDCHRGHQLVKHHSSTQTGNFFFCDCGLNQHQPAVCTFYSSQREFKIQPIYRCQSCFSREDAGVCHQCMINCHRGHKISYVGEIRGFCDCGQVYCRVSCRIPKPM